MPSILLDVPLLSQGDSSDCLPTCVEMVIRFHGLRLQRTKLRQKMQSTGAGTPFSNVVFLTELGLLVEVNEHGTPGLIARSLQMRLPVICAVNTMELPYWVEATQHAIVVIGIEDDRVILNDPYYAQDHKSILLGDFMLAWIERDCQYAIIRPR